MEITVQTAFQVRDAVHGIIDPIEWNKVARSELADHFTPNDQVILASLADSSLPHLLARNAFDPDEITCDTPDEMWTHVSEAVPAVNALICLLCAAGLTPFSYAYENRGILAANLSPKRRGSSDQVSFEKSTKGLRGHTDASCNPSAQEFKIGDLSPSPDFLALACIRNPKNVPTRITLLSTILQGMSPEHRAALTDDFFVLTPQPSFELPATLVRFGPVLWQDRGNWCCRASNSYIGIDDGLYPVHAQALAEFQRLSAVHRRNIVLAPGQILILNNRAVVHGRGPIGAAWGELAPGEQAPAQQARWLLRTYAYLGSTRFHPEKLGRAWVVE